jgi:hypothetical protein
MHPINDRARSFPMPDKWGTNVAKKEALAAAEAAFMPEGTVTVCRETASQILPERETPVVVVSPCSG